MQLYECIFSKYSDSNLVESDLMRDPLDFKNSIVKIVESKNIKEAFEKCVKEDDVDVFWSKHGTIHPYYVNDRRNYVYYHKAFELY